MTRDMDGLGDDSSEIVLDFEDKRLLPTILEGFEDASRCVRAASTAELGKGDEDVGREWISCDGAVNGLDIEVVNCQLQDSDSILQSELEDRALIDEV